MGEKRRKTGRQRAQTSLCFVPNSTPQWQALSAEVKEAAARLITQMYKQYVSGSCGDANEQEEARDE